VIVVTSDHGKEIGEHGMVGHGHVLYEELVRVPLVLAGPGVPPGVDRLPAQSVDLVPTLLGLLGLGPAEGAPTTSVLQGIDLLAADGRDERRALWAEVDAGWTLEALRVGADKTIRDPVAGTYEHFRLDRDPEELEPSDPPTRLRTALDEFAAELGRLAAGLPSAGRGGAELDAGDRAHLEALGYLIEDGRLAAGAAAVRPEVDPRDPPRENGAEDGER
jgi:choline-sulfatase